MVDLPVNLASITISKLHVSVGLHESNGWPNLRRCGGISGFGSLKFVFINLSLAMERLARRLASKGKSKNMLILNFICKISDQ